jgi:hypothetical protein
MPSFPDFSTSPTTTTTTTTTQLTTTTTAPADPESASFYRLRDIASDDLSFVTSSLEDQWVAQLSAKRPGLQAEGIIWDNAQILREHLQLRQQYPGARLALVGQLVKLLCTGLLGHCRWHQLSRQKQCTGLVQQPQPRSRPLLCHSPSWLIRSRGLRSWCMHDGNGHTFKISEE